MKTPAPQRAAGRKKLAAMGQALPDGTAPIPDVAYLKKAIRAKGRVDPSKWPALKALIVKRAKALGATNTPGVKGTWAFQAANDTEALEMATTTAAKPDAHAQHVAHVAHLQHLSDTGKATPAQKTELAKAKAASSSSGSGTAQPRVPAGSPAGGQFGSNSGTSAKTPAQQHAAHVAHVAHLQHLADTGKATPAQKAQLAVLSKALKAKTAATPAKKTTTVTAANRQGKVIDMATATPRKMPMVRGAADVQLRRTGPGVITVQHKSSGMKVGTITPKGAGWQGMHATGTMTGASGSQQGALTGLIAFHNQQAAKAKASGFPPAQQDGTAVMPGSKTYTADGQPAIELADGPAPYHRDPDENVQCPACKKYNDGDARYCDQCGAKLPASAYESAASLANGARAALNLAGALPVSTPASSSSDGPRVTSMGSGSSASAGSPSGLSPYALAIYKKFIAKKMKPNVALAFAKRADAMHLKAAKAA